MLAATLAIVSCGGSGDSKYETTGMLGIPSSAVVGANLIFAATAVNGNPETDPTEFGVLIDSGSPVVLIEPAKFSLPPPATPNDVQTHVDIGFLKDGDAVVTVKKVPALQLSAAMMDEIGFGGILGGNVMRDFSIQLDYAAPMMTGFCLGCTSQARDDVASPGTAIPFTLRGGGRGPVPLTSTVQPTVTIPPTRVPVTVDIDGTSYPFILDTGASEVSVRMSVFDALTADGRHKLTGFPITTVMGDSGASVTRAGMVTVGGEAVPNVPVMTIPGDELLNGISMELDSSGRTQIDGLLGGSFLRNFLVTVDYPKGKLHLQRYMTQTWKDEFVRVGIGLAQTAPNAAHVYAVGNVYAGTDAAIHLQVGDEVWSIDGTSLDTLDPIAADALLDGANGDSKALVVSRAATPTVPVSVAVKVDDLIPAP